MKAGVLAEPVLVGRESELEELIRCLDSVFEGKGKTVFVSGEAGTGKTRIVRKLLGNGCICAVVFLVEVTKSVPPGHICVYGRRAGGAPR